MAWSGIFGGIVLMAIAIGAEAQLYRCTMNDGKTVYSDRKCGPAEQRTTVRITDNLMDNSNLASEAAVRGSSIDADQGGSVAVLGNSSAQTSSKAAMSAAPRSRCRRRG